MRINLPDIFSFTLKIGTLVGLAENIHNYLQVMVIHYLIESITVE